jgi:hypothetical protein
MMHDSNMHMTVCQDRPCMVERQVAHLLAGLKACRKLLINTTFFCIVQAVDVQIPRPHCLLGPCFTLLRGCGLHWLECTLAKVKGGGSWVFIASVGLSPDVAIEVVGL